MRKKIKVIVLLLSVLFLSSGCDMENASTTREIRHAGFSVSNSELECPNLFPSKTGYEKIMFFSNVYAITMDGNFYSLSLGKKYQNNLNCKIPENFKNKKIIAIMDNKVVKTSDGKLYYIVASGDSPAYTPVVEKDGEYGIYKMIFDEPGVLKAMTVDATKGYYYVLKDDGNVYNMVLRKENNKVNKISTSIVYSKSDYNGNIIDFNHVGASSATYVRTGTQIFRMAPQNKEECSRYADVVCDYKMSLDVKLSNQYERILGFSGNFIITDYGKQFSATGA